jgi:hypothetical protein
MYNYFMSSTTTTRFTDKGAKKAAEQFAAEQQALGHQTYIGKRVPFVPKEWQKAEYEYMVDVTIAEKQNS